MSAAHRDWFMLRTRPGFETVAARWIEQVMGGVAYTPVARQAPRSAGGVVAIEAANPIVGWLLARFDAVPDWRLLDECVTATPRLFMVWSGERVVDDQGRKEPVYAPWMMRAADVEALQEREAAGAFDWRPEDDLSARLIGTFIRLSVGPFAGKRARVNRVVDDTCHCGLKMLGRWVNISVQLDLAISGSPLFR
jgi:hypothetical protein